MPPHRFESPPVPRLLGRGQPGTSQGTLAEADPAAVEATPVRLGLIGIGNRGTAPCVPCSSCRACRSSGSATPNPSIGYAGRGSSRRSRAGGLRRSRTRGACSIGRMSTPSSSPSRATCTNRSPVIRLSAGKHLYAEKPLAPTLAGCDRLCLEAARRPSWPFTSGSSGGRIRGSARRRADPGASWVR